MPFFIFLGCWIILGAHTSPVLSFVTALIAAVSASAFFRIKELERRLKGLEQGASQLQAISPAPAVEQSASQPDVETARTPEPPSSVTELAETEELSPFASTFQEPEPQPARAPAFFQPPPHSTREAAPLPAPVSALLRFFTTGNPIARVGAVVLFFGVAFALKLAVDQGYLPIELRLGAAALGGLVLVGLGWKLRGREQYGAILQGTGLGICYLSVFVAFRGYDLIPQPLGFALLVGVTAASALLAVSQDKSALAVLATLGGFLAPILMRTGGDHHVSLFSYLALLNLGVFAMCWFKAWRMLNATAFVFTFLIAGSWAAAEYFPSYFDSSEPFLLFFLALYTAINVLYAARREHEGVNGADALMTFGPPLFAVILQSAMVRHYEYGLAWSAAGFGAFYAACALALRRRYGRKLAFVSNAYFGIGVALLSLAVPAAFSDRITSAVWALESLALIWSGSVTQRRLPRAAGCLLLPASAMYYLHGLRIEAHDAAFLNPAFLGAALLAAAHIAAARFLEFENRRRFDRFFGRLFVVLGPLWWFIGGYFEVWRHTSRWYDALYAAVSGVRLLWVPFGIAVDSLFGTLSVMLLWAVAVKIALPALRNVRFLLVPLQLLCLGALYFGEMRVSNQFETHPFESFGYVSWALWTLVHYALLRSEDRRDKQGWFQHAAALWILTAVAAWECFWLAASFAPANIGWRWAALAAAPAAVIAVVSWCAKKGARFPFKERAGIYYRALLVPAFLVLVWTFIFDYQSPGTSLGLAAPGWIPLLNPLDLAQLAAAAALVFWWRTAMRGASSLTIYRFEAAVLFSLWLFVWATATLLRTIHHWYGVPWDFNSLFESNTVQAALSIFWSLLALVLMSLAHRRSWRGVWKSGAALIGLTVIKLFLVDLSGQGTGARIAAFLGVGILMLGIGYLAPIPPEGAAHPPAK